MLDLLISLGIPPPDAEVLVEVFAVNLITLDLLPLLSEAAMDKMVSN